MSIYLGETPLAGTGADKSLSNLTNTGKNIANWSTNVTNCITEIPQDIKLELNNGTLTLKAGSKVYVPNGAGVFNVVTIASDISVTKQTNDKCFVFYYNNSLFVWEISGATSGTTAPSGTGTWYDTTNNIIKRYVSGSQTAQGLSLPLAILDVNSTAIQAIDQVFNGFGYMGSTIFALPGVKGLIPNGRNEDGSLKNIEVVTDRVRVETAAGTLNGSYFIRLFTDTIGVGSLTYKTDENFNYIDNIKRDVIAAGTIIADGSKITSLTPKTAFHAVDYNDSSTISGWSMPSSRYIDLTLGASGATYTAPANGYISMAMNGTVSGNQGYFSQLYDNGVEIRRFGDQSTSGAYHVFTLNFEIRKGQTFTLLYYGLSPNFFRFIYAEGEN